jgi:hypothetical protein
MAQADAPVQRECDFIILLSDNGLYSSSRTSTAAMDGDNLV